MIASGGVSGGFSSMIAGGNFMDGFRQGIITSGLNHVAHLVNEAIEDPDDIIFKNKKGKDIVFSELLRISTFTMPL